mgnify:CR=1 FL=1
MKKRIISLFFILSLSVFSLSGCKQNPKTDTTKESSTTESTKVPQVEVEVADTTSDIEKNFEQDLKENYLKSGGEIAFLTQSKDIFDKGYCEAIFKGIAQYAYSSGKTYSYYYPTVENKDNFYNTMKTAIDDGAELIVTSSDSYNEIIGSIQYDYSDDYFLMVDGHPTDEENNPIDLNTNVHCIKFDEYTSGYIAGYITAQEGYKNFGFLGGKENDAVKAYGYGFVNGIDDYAKQNNNPADYSLNYCYTNTFSASDEIYKKAKLWYENGTEVIFSCGGNIFKSITQAANETNKNTRPPKAGFMKFCPNPPKDIFTTPIANRAPMKTTHQGVVTGRFIASRSPVTTAADSQKRPCLLKRYFVMAHSTSTQESTLTPRTSSSAHP